MSETENDRERERVCWRKIGCHRFSLMRRTWGENLCISVYPSLVRSMGCLLAGWLACVGVYLIFHFNFFSFLLSCALLFHLKILDLMPMWIRVSTQSETKSHSHSKYSTHNFCTQQIYVHVEVLPQHQGYCTAIESDDDDKYDFDVTMCPTENS